MRPEPVPEQVLPRVSELIARTIGLNFPPERGADLQRGLGSAASELGFESAAACADWLLSAPLTPGQLHTLASHLTIGETYFFREPRTFDALETHVLPQLIRSRNTERRLRIWSAACATGEEPYSLAILLQRLLPQWRDWNITLLATDINARFLERAHEGVYGEWSFRDTAPEFRQRHFTRTAKGRFAILPELRNMVKFAPLNLVQDGFPSLATDTNAMDLILCRNVLIYFTPPQISTLVTKLHQALVPNGWLTVAPSECSQTTFEKFATENFPGAILYRKGAPSVTPAASQAPQLFEPPLAAGRNTAAALVPTQPPEPALRRAMAIIERPDFATAARALANEGRLTDARMACERWMLQNKLEPAAHYLHAVISQELGDGPMARQSLQRVLYLDSRFVLAHLALGNLARDSGNIVTAHRHFRDALELLRNASSADLVPESDGLTAARLTEIIESLLALGSSNA